ncbi:hypothetical protein KAU33_10145 [Candidatus Dependentiae bacterium]|nr:hypothetical protein [Candidatus Dependentiae bacterium]
MKRYLFTLLLIMIIPLYAYADIGINGYFQIDERYQLYETNDNVWHEYRLNLQFETDKNENTNFYSELWIRSWEFTEINNSSDLTDSDKISPYDIEIREAYVDFYNLGIKNLDLKVGRQRIAWGTGDKLNPTDNLNADDLEDLWDFGRHIGSDSIKVSYYFGEFKLELVYIPISKPAILPKGKAGELLFGTLDTPEGLVINNYSENIILPLRNPKENSISGIRLSSNLFGFDFSVSYVYGRDDLPVIQKITIYPTLIPGEVDVNAELIFPRLKVIGFDMAGAIGNVGIWAETAYFIPEKVFMLTDFSGLGLPNNSMPVLDEPYFKYVIGGDYTFKNGVYLNGQYLHGFIHERGEENLKDYFMFGVEYKCFNDKLKIIPIGGGIEIQDFHDIENNYAIIGNPEIAYYPFQNSEFVLGCRFFDGKETTNFGKFKDYDEIYFRVKYNF